MSGGPNDNLSQEGAGAGCPRPACGPVSQKIRQLLAAAGSGPKQDTTQIDTTDYSWREPHYFSTEQLVELENLTGKIAAAVAERFTGFCNSPFDATIASTTQHFADEFLERPSDEAQKDYYLAFGADREPPCGLIGIPEQTAAVWAKELLGDSVSDEDSTRDQSQLEKSLLLDLRSALIGVFSGPGAACGFRPAASIVRGRWPLELEGTEEICKISFNVKKADSEESTAAYLLIACSRLAPLLGKSVQAVDAFSAADISKAVLNHLQNMRVTVTAQLATTMLSFEEIMDLQAGDILLLDKRVDEPVELIAHGRKICRGRPAKSAGEYAVKITATAFEDRA